MTTVAAKRFERAGFKAIADAIALLDLDQEDRESVAEAIGDALDGTAHFQRDLFVLLASDPLVPCAGSRYGPCPDARVIRQAWHDRSAPDGRNPMWRRRAPYGDIRCARCGAEEFSPGFPARERFSD
jgi:hypothetical protein